MGKERRWSRRQLLKAGGAAGALAVAPGVLAACGGGSKQGVPAANAGDPWKQFSGTTLNFISENTAPTSAIAANIGPFNALTGIDVKIVQLELSAMVQKVALDFASGLGAYQVIYADPYQILAPYHAALADLTKFDRDPDLPHIADLDDFIPTQLNAAGRFERKDTIYALPYDAPTMLWFYRKDLFAKHGERMRQDLGFDPMPSDATTWDQYRRMAQWFNAKAKADVPYGTGHMAKQHDSLMNDFSNVLWAYGGDYFADGQQVGLLGKEEPGEPLLDRPEAIQAAEFYKGLLELAHPASLGWDWTGLAEGFGAGQVAMAPLWHEFAASMETGKLKGKVGYARLPRGPKRTASMYGGTGIGVNGVASEREQKAAWLFAVWATSKQTQLANLKSDVGGGTPTLGSVYRLPEVVKAKRPPSKMPNVLTTDAVFEAWKPENIGLRPKIPAWNECDTTMFSKLSSMLAGGESPQSCMQSAKTGFEQAIDTAKSLRTQ